MRFLLTIVPLTAAMIIAACSPSSPDTSAAQPVASATSASPISGSTAIAPPAPPLTMGTTAPAIPALGSPAWFDWVDKALAISDDGHGPKPETPGWNEAVNRKLGQEAPQAKLGSAEWQQAVDALLRTRVVGR